MRKLISVGITALVAGFLFWGCTEVNLPIAVPATIGVVDSVQMESTGKSVMTPDSGFLRVYVDMDSVLDNWQEYVNNVDSLRPDSATATIFNLGQDTAAFYVYFSDDSTLTSSNVADSATLLGSIVIPPMDTVQVNSSNWMNFFDMNGLLQFFVDQIITGDGRFYVYVKAQGVNTNTFLIVVTNYNYFITLFIHS